MYCADNLCICVCTTNAMDSYTFRMYIGQFHTVVRQNERKNSTLTKYSSDAPVFLFPSLTFACRRKTILAFFTKHLCDCSDCGHTAVECAQLQQKNKKPQTSAAIPQENRKNYQNHRHCTLVTDFMYIVDIAHSDAENNMGWNTHHKTIYCRSCGESVESSLIAWKWLVKVKNVLTAIFPDSRSDTSLGIAYCTSPHTYVTIERVLTKATARIQEQPRLHDTDAQNDI